MLFFFASFLSLSFGGGRSPAADRRKEMAEATESQRKENDVF